MKNPLAAATAALFCFFCLSLGSCNRKVIGPYRDLEIGVVADFQDADILLFEMPDSIKIFSGYYNLQDHPNGIHLSMIPDGKYWLVVHETDKPKPNRTKKFEYKGKKSITVEF